MAEAQEFDGDDMGQERHASPILMSVAGCLSALGVVMSTRAAIMLFVPAALAAVISLLRYEKPRGLAIAIATITFLLLGFAILILTVE